MLVENHSIMRRVTKKRVILLFGVVFTALYCEYLIYYVVIAQCSWPDIESSYGREQIIKAFILADTHLLGPRKGHWLDKLRREWQMHRAFQTIITLHSPDVVFVLGDLFDEGEWSNDEQLKDYVNRFYNLFALPKHIKMYVVPGNHDIGFHYYIRRGFSERFFKSVNSSSVQLVTIKDSHFVLVNSMAMEGHKCKLCKDAVRKINEISEVLDCSRSSKNCSHASKTMQITNYSQPILMQHFPLYRKSDEVCTEPDAPPLPEKLKPFRNKVDAISREATDFLVSMIHPRAVFGGHTHHGCLLKHQYRNSELMEFYEYSVPSFSWRNRADPKYMLVAISPNAYDVNKCGLPKESTIVLTAVVLLALTIYLSTKRTIGR